MLSTDELRLALNEGLAENSAADIVTVMEQQATPDNLEVDFRISEGKMVGGMDSPNTWFKIDCPEGTDLHRAKEILAEVFSEDFNAEDKVQFDRMEERKIICEEFRELIRTILNSGMYHARLSVVLRKAALGDVPASLVPIEMMRFLVVDIGDAGEDDYLLSIEKIARVDAATGQWLNPPSSVNEDLFRTHRETGMDFMDIIRLRRTEHDPRYDLVAGVTKKRYSFELHCEIVADYSFCEPPEYVRNIA